MTADEFVEAAFGFTESECTIDEFYAEFGTAKQDGYIISFEGTVEWWWVQYDCRDESVILYLDLERWEAGYVEIVDSERE